MNIRIYRVVLYGTSVRRLTPGSHRYLVVEHVPEEAKSAVKKSAFDRHLPDIKFVLVKPSDPEQVSREIDWVTPDLWIDCSLIGFTSICYPTLASVVESTQAARGFYSDMNVRHQCYDPSKHGHGAYVPERIGHIRLKPGSVLSCPVGDLDSIEYSYLFSRQGLGLVVEEKECQSITPESIHQLLRLGHNVDMESCFAWQLSVTCCSGILPSVFAAVSPHCHLGWGFLCVCPQAGLEMDVQGRLSVTIANRIPLDELQRVFKISAKAYCRSRQLFYAGLDEEQLNEELPFVDHDEPIDWDEEEFGGYDGAEPMFDLFSMKIHEADKGREDSAEEDDADADADVSQDDDALDKYFIKVYNANVRPGAVKPYGQPGLFVSIECDRARTHEDVVISRTLYT